MRRFFGAPKTYVRDIRLLSKLLFLVYKVGALGVFA